MTTRRTRCLYAGTVLLSVALTACSSTSPVNGTIAFTTVRGSVVAITNPEGGVCHDFGPLRVAAVDNGTLADILMFQGPNCTNPDGSPGLYVPTGIADRAVLTVGPWRSYRTYV
jgi:hypothetical protein